MSVLICIVSHADGSPCAASGFYVRRYTPDGFGGMGRIVLTGDTSHARRYPDAAAAAAEWKRASATHPRRADGKPNRPMTAYTVEIMPAPDA